MSLRSRAQSLAPEKYAALRSFVRLAREDWQAPFSFSEKLFAWRNGFLSETAAAYDLAHKNPRDYLTDFALKYRCVHLNGSRTYFNHKLAFRSLLLRAGVAQPETVALIAHGRVLMNPLGTESQYVSASELEQFLMRDGGRFIVKPESATGGQGVFLLQAHNGCLMRQRGQTRTPFNFSDVPTVALIERAVQQGSFWKTLFPESANTLRVLTGWMPDEPKPFIIRTVQRMGTADTIPIDAWVRGGISALVDLPTGRLSAGRAYPPTSKYGRSELIQHPDSGAQIEGAQIPQWDKIRDTVLQIASSSPAYRYVGWDVVVDEHGIPVIIEANGNSSLNFLQVFGGLLADPNARQFYERCGVLA